jgi:hypothetical protein
LISCWLVRHYQRSVAIYIYPYFTMKMEAVLNYQVTRCYNLQDHNMCPKFTLYLVIVQRIMVINSDKTISRTTCKNSICTAQWAHSISAVKIKS